MRGGALSGAGAVPARAERRLSRRLRRSLSDLGGLGAAACWVPSASVRAPEPSAFAGEGAVAVEDDGNERKNCSGGGGGDLAERRWSLRRVALLFAMAAR
jgi:hypothetical protein